MASTIADLLPLQDNVTSTTTTTQSPFLDTPNNKFPYPIVMIAVVWISLAFAYLISKWRQKGKAIYIIPRVFVLCSPRNVQFHYELILRIGLPSYDFNPDKHDIDLTVQGQQKNEVVPMTRLNTKTLFDEPLITSLSIIVYRLVEMPPLGGLILKHSGPFRSWIYAYDFTVIDLTTNKEQYYTLNQYIGSLNRVAPLDETRGVNNIEYPIDDVPLPQWSVEDIFLLVFTVINCMMLTITMMPINCTYQHDIVAIFLTAFGGGTLVFFLDWLLYYHARWNQDRKDFFSDYETSFFVPRENVIRITVGVISIAAGAFSIYFAFFITDLRESLVWFLAVLNCCVIVIGNWNVARQAEIGESIVALGLRLRGVEMISVGMGYSEMVSDIRTKSGSISDDGNSLVSTSKISRSFGPRSSVKSFGFDPITGHPSKRVIFSNLQSSRFSSTGATPNNHPNSRILHNRPPRQRNDLSEAKHTQHSLKHSPNPATKAQPVQISTNLKTQPTTAKASPASSSSKSESEGKKSTSEKHSQKAAKTD